MVTAAAYLCAGAATVRESPVQRTEVFEELCCSQIVALAPSALVSRYILSPAAGDTPQASSRAARRGVPSLLPAGDAPESGLQVKTILAARAISAEFPAVEDIGGVRPDSLKWHPHGLAIDVMIPNYGSAAGIALGDSIVAYALANAERFGLEHVIWRQRYYGTDGTSKMMSDYGSDNANHYNHVHIATVGGGYPTGLETYLR